MNTLSKLRKVFASHTVTAWHNKGLTLYLDALLFLLKHNTSTSYRYCNNYRSILKFNRLKIILLLERQSPLKLEEYHWGNTVRNIQTVCPRSILNHDP